MIYKGVEFTVTAGAAGAWNWQFQIGDQLVTGKTKTRLYLLAVKRVQMRIDRELKMRLLNKPPLPGSRSGF